MGSWCRRLQKQRHNRIHSRVLPRNAGLFYVKNISQNGLHSYIVYTIINSLKQHKQTETLRRYKMFHTSPNKIEAGMINGRGIAADCLFFSDEIYTMTASKTVYVYEADFNCVKASELHDESIISRIAEYFGCDEDLAESLLDGSESEWNQEFYCTGEDSWFLQGLRGECAVKMGYDGCEDEDEQGVVYIVPMFGRESELTLIEV